MIKEIFYISMDYSQAGIALAYARGGTFDEPKVLGLPPRIDLIKQMLNSLKGKKVMVIEETNSSQWLWVELHELVDRLIICDPYYNYLLRSGPKNDRIDALKLLDLLRAGLLTEVYHSNHRFIEYRKLISTYDDVVKSGVRWKNQRSAILRSVGKRKEETYVVGRIDKWNLGVVDRHIALYEEEKEKYEKIFRILVGKNKQLRALRSIPGVGYIGAVKIAAVVVSADRFKSKGRFHSYCGLVKHKKMSGGISYGKRSPRHSRTLKSVFKTAANAVIYGRGENSLKDYYRYLINEKGYAPHNARNKVARKIATIALEIMRRGKYYNPRRKNKCNKK